MYFTLESMEEVKVALARHFTCEKFLSLLLD
jgi:hypothetical protein